MREDELHGINDRTVRADILKLVRRRHRAQQRRLDHVALWRMLRGIGIDIGEYDALTLLQDMESAGLIEFERDPNEKTNETRLVKIQLCPRGLAVLEGRIKDDTVLL